MLKVHTFCFYPSYDGLHEWRQTDYNAYKLVKALKGQKINGYVKFNYNGKSVNIEDENKEVFLPIFGNLAAQKVRLLELDDPVIVAIPSSDCREFNNDDKANRLASTVADQLGGIEYYCPFRWKIEMLKASQGGPRNATVLYELLDCELRLEKRNVVLIDDVVTTGGHIIACANYIRTLGNTVEHAVCLAQTVKEPREKMLALAEQDLEEIWAENPLTNGYE